MTTYYVSVYGNNSNSGTGTGPDEAWRSIEKAFMDSKLKAGDTVKILPGNYTVDSILMSKSGTEDNPIVIEANSTAAVADYPKIRSTKTSARPPLLELRDVSWVTVRGLEFREFYGAGIWLTADTQDVLQVHFYNNRIVNTLPSTGHMFKFDVSSKARSVSFCTVDSNYLYDAWPAEDYDPSDPTKKMFGNECITFIGNVHNCWIKDNTLIDCINIGPNQIGWDDTTGALNDKGQPHDNIISGNVIIDHYNSAAGGNSLYTDRALGPTLIENNIIITTRGCHAFYNNAETGRFNGSALDKSNWGRVIVRNNIFGADIGVAAAGYQSDKDESSAWERWAHNVHIATSVQSFKHGPLLLRYVRNLQIKNSVFVWRGQTAAALLNWLAKDGTPPASMTTNWLLDGNLWYSSAGNTVDFVLPYATYASWAAYQAAEEPNGQWGDPVFEDESGRDYRLDAASPGYGDAIPLTYANGAAAGGSSATLYVDDARWFCDGFFLQGGDRISVGGTSAVVTAVDYTNNRLTLDSAIAWDDDDPVYYDHSGSRSIGLQDEVSSGDAQGTPGGDVEEPPPPPPPDPAPPTEGVELLNNGDFAVNEWGGLGKWNKYTAGSATFSLAGGDLDVAVASTGGNTQVYQPGFAIESGETYELSFDAVATSGSHNVTVVVHKHYSPWTTLGLDDVAVVTTTPTTFTYEFVATGAEDVARLRFSFQATGGATLSFDDVSLRKLTFAEDGGGGGGGGTSDSTTLSIASGADDLDYRPSGAWVGDSTNTHRIGLDTVERAGIMRFVLDKAIPDGATITSALLDLYADVAGTGSGWDITISVADAADPAMPTSNAEIDAHTWEDSATTWQPSALSADTRYDTSDFSDALQAVVDSQGGLANGAAILIKQRDAGAVAGSRLARFESYDGSVAAVGNATRAANLELAWTTPGGSINPTRTMNQPLARTMNQTFGM